MITPRIKPSGFFPEEAPDDMFLVRHRKAKLEGYVQTLAAMDAMIDSSEMASAVDSACPRAARSKGGRPPYATEVLVRMVFLQGLYNLSDEQCEHQVLDRLSFQRFCRLDGALHIPDARTLWSFRQRLAQGGLGGKAIFETLSQQLQQHGFIPRGGQIVDASIVQAPITQASAKERDALNRGDAPEGWSAKRLAHTDREARWTRKHGKSVSAIGALRLVEQGKLSLDGAANRQLSAWQIPGNAFTQGHEVSLRMLLNHSAGLSVHGFDGYEAGQKIPTLLQVLDGLPPANSAPVRVEAAPGTAWRYSGGGFSVVQLMMSEASPTSCCRAAWPPAC